MNSAYKAKYIFRGRDDNDVIDTISGSAKDVISGVDGFSYDSSGSGKSCP